MKNRTLLILFINIIYYCPAFSQEEFRVMFYNVENLFDCEHDSLKNDYDFLPESMRAWHYGRYKEKLRNISRVICAVGEWKSPALVGLCEVENDKVMKDLTERSPLKEYGYRYVMTDSPDDRGIDVALLWQRDRFKYVSHHPIRVYFKDKTKKPTRDILHVTGLVHSGDTLDIFVCHLPSRSGGAGETEPARLEVASVIKQKADSLCQIRTYPAILIMGDFNDYPDNASIANVLNATTPGSEIQQHHLYNLMADKGTKIGTYNYQGEWGILDHIIVSGYLLQNISGFHTSNERAKIIDFPFLLKENPKYGGMRPFRTYYGMKYEGGYSDHLPVMVDFFMPE